ncbi:hypothetical protein CN692_02030 [Bacillus sp. AFS002410]|nr:hypothetical protein CN692_02030 [Bacillus sp. AFS002410]
MGIKTAMEIQERIVILLILFSFDIFFHLSYLLFFLLVIIYWPVSYYFLEKRQFRSSIKYLIFIIGLLLILFIYRNF